MVLLPGGFRHLLELAALAALVGGLAAIERKGAFQLMLSRPLVIAPLLGALLGDARCGLMLGLPLELLFLGGVNLGGSLPDNETLLAAALTAMVVPAGRAAQLSDPALIALGFALLFPLAHLGRSLEAACERRNGELYELALARAAAGDPRAARVNLRGLLLPFGATAGICALCVLASPALAAGRLALSPRLVLGLEGGWHAIWALAAAAAIRALRDPRALVAATFSAAAVFALYLAARGLM
jgi:mannose/fructose/N-acetylgalactosamine-specific phosphotransferase system component IIC